jgi:hypothetical protein
VDEVGNHGPILPDLSVENHWSQATHTGPANGGFGYNLWNIGDVDNDGRDDLAVSAIFLNSGAGTNQGAVFVFYSEDDLGNWSDPDPANRQQLNRTVGGELFGFDVSGAGDLNGDQIADLAVGGHGFDGNRGRVSIYFGNDGSPLTDAPDAEIRAALGSIHQFGRSVEILGDINNDGYDDLFVSAPTSDSSGRGYIFFGRSQADWNAAATGNDGDAIDYVPVASADINILGVDADDWFGYRHGTAALGDLDGDGFDDFLTVASGVSEIYTFDGAAVSAITTRDVDPSSDSVDVISDGTTCTSSFRSGFGVRASGARDLTGDGLLDVVVTNSCLDHVYLLSGVDNSPGDPPMKIGTSFTKDLSWPRHINFGWDLDVGDVNLDGWPDLLLGTNGDADGSAFLFFNTGTSPFFEDDPGSTLTDTDYYGISVALGDFDGNGLPDVAVGTLKNMLYIYY